MNETGIKAWTDMDLNYSYRGLSAFGGEFSFTLGSRNIFDRAAQRSPMPAGILAELQTPLAASFTAAWYTISSLARSQRLREVSFGGCTSES